MKTLLAYALIFLPIGALFVWAVLYGEMYGQFLVGATILLYFVQMMILAGISMLEKEDR